MDNSHPKLTFYGGVGMVTGANFLFERDGKKILIDCGIAQGSKYAEEKNKEDFPYSPSDIEAVILTHAHMDHIGRVPKLVKDGFRGKIYSTKQTKEMAPIMYEDALKIMRMEADSQKGNSKSPEEELIYQKEHAEKAIKLWQSVDYHEKFSPADGIEAELYDAGHILGSATASVRSAGVSAVFSGDLGNMPSALVKETEFHQTADYMVIESVYGDRLHEERDIRKDKLKDAIEYVLKSKGTLMIPAFSLERTQIILHEINDMVESGEISKVPVYLDSPLAIKLTEVYKNAPKEIFGSHIREDMKTDEDVFDFPGLSITRTREESKQIFKMSGPKVVVAGSGMSAGGRIIYHEKFFLGKAENMLLFVGYQAPGSLGREIQDGEKNIKIFGDDIKIKAKIDSITGYSSHADRDQLLSFVEASAGTLKKVFVAMGEPKSSMFLAQRINDYLGVEAVVPEEGDSFLLE